MNTSAVATKSKGQRSGTAIRAKGQQRITDIFNAARAILIEDGYTQFSLRNIASRAGIHLSNLQYYFPGKDELIHGLLESIANSYDEKYSELFDNLPEEPEVRFQAAVEYLISDIRDAKTRRFFIQLWALLESSDAHSGILLNELYALHIVKLNSLIALINPALSEGRLQQRSAMIAAMIEGMMLMIDDADTNLSSDESGIEEEMQKQIIRIALDE